MFGPQPGTMPSAHGCAQTGGKDAHRAAVRCLSYSARSRTVCVCRDCVVGPGAGMEGRPHHRSAGVTVIFESYLSEGSLSRAGLGSVTPGLKTGPRDSSRSEESVELHSHAAVVLST
eukprot:scaffold20821_cov47-Attheya_sp.AAC.3